MRDHPYAPFIDRVHKPAQYLGGEQGESRKAWDDVACRMCLAFPDLYEIGMSHLGYKILYDIVNKRPDFLAERAYAVWADMEHELRSHDQPLCSLESARPLHEFDIVGFSLQYELTYTNVLQILELGKIPLRSEQRSDAHPLIIAGGPTATHAEPMAPFIDAFLIGDGEAKVPELMHAWAEMKAAGLPRAERLLRIAHLGGFYVPALYKSVPTDDTEMQVVEPDHPEAPFPVRRSIVQNLNDYPFPVDGPIANCQTVFDRASIEVARGCTEGCRFCQAGMIYRPVREREPKAIIEAMVRSVSEAGYDEASLTSLSTADYSAIAPLVHESIEALAPHQVSLSVSSLRAYGLSEDVLDDMKRQRAGGLTFAPEAGSQRMRDVVNKNVTDDQLMLTAERVFSRGWSKMKLYFMIGLPTEEDDDVRDIVRTGARALDVARRVQRNKRARVTVSVSTHVPKPHTPFQWCAMDSRDEIIRKQSVLRYEAAATRVQLKMHSSAGSWLEGMLARGDRRLADVIHGAYTRGARFDSWDERLDLAAWTASIEEAAIDPSWYLGTIPVSARLPWSHIDVGLEQGFLAREYRKALRNRLSPPCGKTVGSFVHHTNVKDAKEEKRRLVCYDCGIACDLTQMREERIGFLRDMNSLEPRAALAPPEEVAEVAMVDRRPFHGVDQGPPMRVRIAYRKLGRTAYTSHLDLVRSFPRMLRRVGLPLYYSEGYRPLPRLTFGPALPVGTASLCEHVDVRLREAESPNLDNLCARLNDAAIDGIEFFEHQVLGPHDAALNRVIEETDFVVAMARGELAALGFVDEKTLRKTLAKRPTDLYIDRDIKGVKKRVDVGAALVDVRVGHGADALSQAGLVGDLLPITITLRLGGQTTPRPGEVLRALTGIGELAPRVVRSGFFANRPTGRVTPLQLELLRAKPSLQAAE
ncbi:MAG: TIGR03960 family B12-binding radical SAM protein [Deltaproteobacteria bacterium]|nr:TIGR03960 family B12-binding radical SAM protein [Deltaproteobacteria bacterium]